MNRTNTRAWRTPQGLKQTLAGRQLNAEERNFLAMTILSGDDLLAAVDDLEMNNPWSRVRADWNDLPAMLIGATRTFQPQAARQGMTFACAVDPGLPRWWHFDRGKLRRILAHLLTHALRPTAQGRVLFAATWLSNETTPRLEFVIRDPIKSDLRPPGDLAALISRLGGTIESHQAAAARANETYLRFPWICSFESSSDEAFGL